MHQEDWVMSNQLTKKDVNQAMLRSWGYQWLSFNYETMQSCGFTWFITPSLEKIYDDKAVVSKKANQYASAFYNTENTMGQIIHGAILGLEESGVDGVTDTAVALRTGLMGPFAGLGDSIFKVSSKVIFGSLAGYMALDGSIVGMLLCIALCIFCNGFVRYWFFQGGYHQGVEFITNKKGMIQGLTAAVTVMGIVVVGAMIPSTVKITVPLVYTFGEATQAVQDILDRICPYLLPAITTFLIYKGLGSKKMTTVRMVWLIIAICIVLTYFGIL